MTEKIKEVESTEIVSLAPSPETLIAQAIDKNYLLTFFQTLTQIKITKNGCWRAKGKWRVKEYAYIWFNKKLWRMHRLSYILFHGILPIDLFVCHKCDVRDCINPDHLFMGTALDNGRDNALKGRSAKGSQNGNSKLIERNIKEIKSLYKLGMTSGELGRYYNVDRTLIWQIIVNKIWRHVL